MMRFPSITSSPPPPESSSITSGKASSSKYNQDIISVHFPSPASALKTIPRSNKNLNSTFAVEGCFQNKGRKVRHFPPVLLVVAGASLQTTQAKDIHNVLSIYIFFRWASSSNFYQVGSICDVVVHKWSCFRSIDIRKTVVTSRKKANTFPNVPETRFFTLPRRTPKYQFVRKLLY